MNRGTTILVALALILLVCVGAEARTSKTPTAQTVQSTGGTITATMVCNPTSGTLPLDITLWATVYNQTNAPRVVHGRVDLETAGGLYVASISSGEVNLPAGVGEFYLTSWVKPLTVRFATVGLNRYHLLMTDITPPPYNQPPYPPAGTEAADDCTVYGTIP
jgi:hypothetical protein